MSNDYSGPMDGVKDFSAGVLSGDMFSASEKLEMVRSNMSFRINSAREMVMGLTGSSSMTPMERRSEIRQRRLELLGIGGGSEADASPTRTEPSPSGQIGEQSSEQVTTPTTSPTMTSDDSPLMSEVDKGTKARASDRGFGT